MDSTVIVAIIGLASAVSVSVIGSISNRKGKRSKEEQAISDGLQCLLRAEIIRSYEKYSEKGYCPLYAKEALTRAYNSYHELGGNDVATDLYDKIMDMSESPRKEEII